MNFIVVGTNHKYSPIEVREKLSFSKRSLKDGLFFLKERDVLNGAVILSTCNRVEVYASAEDTETGIEEIEYFISRYHEIDRQKFSPYLYIYKGRDAVTHLLSVTSGLDSLILGETQILGQVKLSVFEAENAGFVDELLKHMFYSAVSFAKRIHRETKISEGKVSVGSVAIDFIKEKIGSLYGKNVLIIGVGKVTSLVLKYLCEEQPNVVFVANRTFEKAKCLARQVGAKAVRFDELKTFLYKADIVISATASPHYIIREETLREIGAHRLLIIDLALPRDVDPRVKGMENIELFCLEDLDAVIKKNVYRKFREAEKVKGIIGREAERIWERFIRSEREPARLL